MIVHFTANQFMGLGLELAGYKRWRSYKEKANIERFKAHFGAHPRSCEQMWIKLQTTTNDECRIDSSDHPKYLLLAFHFLWEYPTEKKFYSMFQITEKTVRHWCEVWTRKIQALLPDVVRMYCDVNDS